MRPIDTLIETTEILHSALEASDGDKAFDAVTILLMQVVEFFGFVEGTFEIMFPFLEQLKYKIEAENFEGAERDAFNLLTKFRTLRQLAGRKKRSATRLNS